MKAISDLVYLIEEELDGAKCYAEKYVQFKAENDMMWANKFKEMSNNELVHAVNIHDLAMQKINQLKAVYTAPAEMQEMWDKQHAVYVDKTAWIKQMLAM